MELKNRSAYYEYFIDDTYTAGMVLTGTEVKSLREGKASFNDSFCILHKNELWLKSLHIAEYSHGTSNNHDPLRDRKLLLQKREIKKIDSKLRVKGHAIVPLRIFFNENNTVQIRSTLDFKNIPRDNFIANGEYKSLMTCVYSPTSSDQAIMISIISSTKESINPNTTLGTTTSEIMKSLKIR